MTLYSNRQKSEFIVDFGTIATGTEHKMLLPSMTDEVDNASESHGLTGLMKSMVNALNW